VVRSNEVDRNRLCAIANGLPAVDISRWVVTGKSSQTQVLDLAKGVQYDGMDKHNQNQ
jgi:hypothetical protein